MVFDPKLLSAFASLAYFDAVEISVSNCLHDNELSLGPTTLTTCGVAQVFKNKTKKEKSIIFLSILTWKIVKSFKLIVC